jgi:adenine deaminase
MTYKPFNQTPDALTTLLAVARGDAEADLVLSGGKLVNVLSGEIYECEIAISGGRFAGISRQAGTYQGRETIDLGGEYVAPGLIDGHVHIESSLCVPAEFANAVLPHGTTSVVSDPHEIANVHGIRGIRYMLSASEGLPLRVFVMLSSCVPATDMETSGARLSASDLAPLLDEPRVLGVAELMNYPGVIGGAPDMIEKALMAHEARVRADGHAPLVGGLGLQAYAAAGVTSDHESVGAEEAWEKLRAGLHILIREGSTAKNLDALISIVNEHTAHRCSFATDDKQPDDLAREGHIDHALRKAIAHGVDPVLALSMATINTARHYGLNDLGAVAPGYHADFFTFSDLHEVRPNRVYAGGKPVAENGRLLGRTRSNVPHPPNSMRVATISADGFAVRAAGQSVRAIGVVPEQIVTEHLQVAAELRDGKAVADTARDLLKIAVVERHSGTGNIGLGFVQGVGLREGALASTVAHDSHNIVLVGATDEDLAAAARSVVEMGGGLCAVRGGEVLARLPLPVAGLMSTAPWEEVRDGMEALLGAARALGSPLLNPYMALAFLALPVIPALKITDRGLVDVTQFKIVPLFLED